MSDEEALAVTSMQPPAVLDPDRPLSDNREGMGEAEPHPMRQLHAALEDSCAYAQQLWHRLDEVREYLIESAPQNPRATAGPPRRSATPLGPDDHDGWGRWHAMYAGVLTTLLGPHADGGFGEQEASREERDRRLPSEVPHDLPTEAFGEGAAQTWQPGADDSSDPQSEREQRSQSGATQSGRSRGKVWPLAVSLALGWLAGRSGRSKRQSSTIVES